MCLWGQRGLRYDACAIYWGRSIRCSWSEPWTLAKKGMPEVTPRFRHIWTTDTLSVYHGDGGFFTSNRAGCKMNLASHCKDDRSICDHTHKKNTSGVVSHYSYGFIIVGVLHMRFGSNPKNQAYVNFFKKIIYPSASLYKVCSKKEYLSLGTELLLSPSEERGESSPAPLWLQRHAVKSSFWFKWMEPRSGPRSLDATQHAITSQSSAEHMFLWETRGGFRNSSMEGLD